MLGGATPDFNNVDARRIFGTSANLWYFVVPFFLVDALTNGEDIGWRGYVLPRLQARFSALVSSLILGVVWGLWHLPELWVARDTESFALTMLHNTAMAVPFTWVHESTNGSLLLLFRMEDTMKSLTLNGFREWLDMYGRASEDGDPKAASGLFARNAEYYETPLDEPMIGQDAIHRYWSRASQALKDVRFSYEILAVKGNLGIALWQGRFVSVASGNHVALNGVFLVEFDEQGKCTVFREWWHRQEIDASPFGCT